MTDTFVIQGAVPLRGEVELSGAKNASYKIAIAATMLKGPVEIEHYPRIKDCEMTLDLIKHLGGKAGFIDDNTVAIDGTDIGKDTIDFLYGSKIRASFLFTGPILQRFNKAIIPNPGGCRLGARPIDRIIHGMEALGLEVNYDSATGYYDIVMNKKPSGTFEFVKPSHTGTECLILIGLLTDTEVILKNTAQEPEIDIMINFLNKAGANIKRQGLDIIISRHSMELKLATSFYIPSDRIEAVTFAVAALATKGDVTVKSIEKRYIETFIDTVKKTGAGVDELPNNNWRFYYKNEITAQDITTRPHPGFLTDWQPLYAVLMTQSNGISIIHETVLENRFKYVEELNKLGADIQFVDVPVKNPEEVYQFKYDPSYKLAIRIHGPKKLHNGVMKIMDIRAGATLALAGLVAEGESVIHDVYHFDRGYERFEDKVVSLGGNVKRIV